MKSLTKINSSVFKINFDITKFFGNLFIIFSLLPWVNFGLNNMDSQPWSFVFGIFFLLSLKKVTFPDYSINILVLVFVGLVFTFLRTNSLEIFFSSFDPSILRPTIIFEDLYKERNDKALILFFSE